MILASSSVRMHNKFGKAISNLKCACTTYILLFLIKYSLAWTHFLDSLSSKMSVFTFHFFHKSINLLFIQLPSQPPSQCLWKDSFVLLHLLLCVERKWFAFCMLFIESFSTEKASPPPDGSEHPRTAATHHLMSYFLIGSSCSQTLWLLWANAQLYRLWVSCSEA